MLDRADAHVRRPRDVATLRELPDRRPARRGGDVLPPARAGLSPSACWCSCPRTSRPRTSSPTTPTSPPTPTPGSRTPQRFVDEAAARSGWATSRSSSRWPATTATSCSTASRAAFARSGSSRRPTSPRWPRAGASPTEVMFLGERDRLGCGRPSTARPTSSSPTTSSPTCPTSSTSARDCARWSPTTARVSIEIPHLLRLIEGNEYDTIYHEHFSYLSLLTTQRVLAAAGLTVVDVEELPTHGGSLRTWSMPTESARPADALGRGACWPRRPPPACTRVEGHDGFAAAVATVRNDLLEFLIGCARGGQDGRRLRRARQGQHAAEPLRHPVAT